MNMSNIVLRINRAEAGQGQVNIQTQVNSASIRRETCNGRDHCVMPSYTLPANVVMNGGLYPASEIDAYYQQLEGTLAPLGHPTVEGRFVSAFSPEGINQGHIGAGLFTVAATPKAAKHRRDPQPPDRQRPSL
jgi:hypothetical protein